MATPGSGKRIIGYLLLLTVGTGKHKKKNTYMFQAYKDTDIYLMIWNDVEAGPMSGHLSQSFRAEPAAHSSPSGKVQAVEAWLDKTVS